MGSSEHFFLTESDAKRIFAGSDVHAPCAEEALQWKVLFALGRYGGLRIPSESHAMRWEDIETGFVAMTVTCQKTRRYKETRRMHIVPELASLLNELRLPSHASGPILTL